MIYLIKKNQFLIKPDTAGQSILEIVIALGVFLVFASAMISVIIGGFSLNERDGQYLVADNLAQEGVEAVRSIRNRSWLELNYNRSAVEINTGQWRLSGEDTTEQIGNFTRIIDFSPVYRDVGGNIVEPTDPGATLDANSKLVLVTIGWQTREGIAATIERNMYLTNWQ
jgi:hypothetical protein